MPRNADDYAIDLEGTPERARRVGIIQCLFTHVEPGPVPILSWTAGMTLDQAWVLLERQKRNSRKTTSSSAWVNGFLLSSRATPKPGRR